MPKAWPLLPLLLCACTTPSAADRAPPPTADEAVPRTGESPPPAGPEQAVHDSVPPFPLAPAPGIVIGRVWERGKWCKGVAPGPGEMQRVSELRPSGRTLLVRRGGVNSNDPPYIEFSTGPAAKFEVKLPRGTWCIVDARKREVPDVPTELTARDKWNDPVCLANIARTCDMVVEVGDERLEELQLRYVRECSWGGPCYHGPAPP